MIRRKKTKIFSTILLMIAVLISNQAGFRLFVFAENEDNTAADNADNKEPVASADGAAVLGGIPPESEIASGSVYVYNLDMGVEVYSKNADERVLPASAVKIMTALVVLENEKDLGRTAEYPAFLNDEFNSGDPNKDGAATAGFDHNNKEDPITVLDALYGMLLPSGCEAANILAYNVGQNTSTGGQPDNSIENFVAMMNAKAAELGAAGTHFSNPHGLYEPETYTTARDMFLITKYVYEKYPRFGEIVSTPEYNVPYSEDYNPEGLVVNSNRLLRKTSPYYYEFAKGIKTGGYGSYSTKSENGEWVSHEGVANLISVAARSGYQYMIVTMNAPWHTDIQTGEQNLHYAYTDHKTLYSWAFSTFEKKCVMRATDPITQIEVRDGTADSVQLFPQLSEDFWTLLPKSLDADSAIDKDIELVSDECTCGKPPDDCECDIRKGVVTAPIEKGALLGTVELKIRGQTLGEKQHLIAGDSVEMSGAAKTRKAMESVLGQWWFKLLLLALGILAIVLIVLNYIHHNRKQLQRARKKPPNRRIRR